LTTIKVALQHVRKRGQQAGRKDKNGHAWRGERAGERAEGRRKEEEERIYACNRKGRREGRRCSLTASTCKKIVMGSVTYGSPY